MSKEQMHEKYKLSLSGKQDEIFREKLFNKKKKKEVIEYQILYFEQDSGFFQKWRIYPSFFFTVKQNIILMINKKKS